MGIETGLLLAGMTVISQVGKANYQNQAAQSQLSALKLQKKQSELEYSQKSLSNAEVVDSVLNKQLAEAADRGYDLSSSSFLAIQKSAIGKGEKEQKNLDIGYGMDTFNNMVEKSNVKNKLTADLFADITDTAFMGADIWDTFGKKDK